MATYTTPIQSQGVGVPAQASDTLVTGHVALITGSQPAILTVDHEVADSQTLADLTVVGFNASGEIVAALWHATPGSNIYPIGVLVKGITTATPTSQPGAAVYRAGCFNPDALVWPASFDTAAKKMAAFEGAPSPTNIILRAPKQATV